MIRSKELKIAASVIAGLFVFVAFLGSWYSVSEGERGVVTRYGKIIDVAQPGLSFKVPLLDSVRIISVQDHVEIYKELQAYSRDQQPATLGISVSYRVDSGSVADVYRVYGDRQGLVDRLITRKVMEETKTVFGQFNAESSIRERGRLNQEVAAAIQKSVDGPVVIIGVQIEDVEFSLAYERSVEERMLAEVAVQRELQNLEKEKVQADIVRTQAAGEADKVRFAANAEADAIRLKGNAEAEAITARAKALGDNPMLIELVKAERWNGVLPTTVLPDSAIPFIGK